MRQNQFHQDINQDIVLDGRFEIAAPEHDMGRPSLAARLMARLFASRLDREVEAGTVVVPGTPLAAHVARLTSVQERHSRRADCAGSSTQPAATGAASILRSRFTRVRLRDAARRSRTSLCCCTRPVRCTRAGWPGCGSC